MKGEDKAKDTKSEQFATFPDTPQEEMRLVENCVVVPQQFPDMNVLLPQLFFDNQSPYSKFVMRDLRQHTTQLPFIPNFTMDIAAHQPSFSSPPSTPESEVDKKPLIKAHPPTPHSIPEKRFAACMQCHTARRRCTLTTEPERPCKRCKDKGLSCETRPRKRAGIHANGSSPEQKMKTSDRRDHKHSKTSRPSKRSDPLQVCKACHNAKRRCSLMTKLDIPCARCSKKRIVCNIRPRKRLGRPSMFASSSSSSSSSSSNSSNYDRPLKLVKTQHSGFTLDLSGLGGLSSKDLPSENWLQSHADDGASDRFHQVWVNAWREKFCDEFMDKVILGDDVTLRQATIDSAFMGNLGEARSTQLLDLLKLKTHKKLSLPLLTFSLSPECYPETNSSVTQSHMDITPAACIVWASEYGFDPSQHRPLCNASLFMNKECTELLGLTPNQYLELHQKDPVPLGYRCYHEDDWPSLLRANVHDVMFSGKSSSVHKHSRICRIRTNRGHVVACVMSQTIKFNELGLVVLSSTCFMPLPGHALQPQKTGDVKKELVEFHKSESEDDDME